MKLATSDTNIILEPVLNERARKEYTRAGRDVIKQDRPIKKATRVGRKLDLDLSYNSLNQSMDFDIEEGNTNIGAHMPQSLSPKKSARHLVLDDDQELEPLAIYKPSETCPDNNNDGD